MSRRSNVIAVGASPTFGQHDMGFRHLTSLGYGRLQPVVVQECVPNDQIKCDIEAVVTNAPFASCLQSKILMNCAAFFVRNRVIWENWDDYITGVANYSIPSFPANILNSFGSLPNDDKAMLYGFHSAMGLPVGDTNWQVPFSGQSASTSRYVNFSLLPYRAYKRVWWDFFRDSNVIPDSQESSYIFRGNGGDVFNEQYRFPHFCCWAKDWMTNNLRTPNGDSKTTAGVVSGSTAEAMGARIASVAGATQANSASPFNASTATSAVIDLNTYANDASSNNGIVGTASTSIQSLRDASAIQKWLEKCNALGGRMRDRLLGMFGSSVAWQNLNMSEYLGSNQFIITGETTQATQSNASTEDGMDNPFTSYKPNHQMVKGQLSTGSKMQTGDGLHNINYHVQEHGYFIVLAWIMPDVFESDGIPAHWLRGVDGITKSRFDFLTPEMVGTGFEPLRYIDFMHLECDPNVSPGFNIDYSSSGWNPFKAVGYRGRYESYKYNQDIISGCFADPRYKNTMKNMYFKRDLLAENDINVTGASSANEIPSLINYDTLSEVSVDKLYPYNDKFMYNYNNGDDDHSCDYFICNFKVGLSMVRPISGISMPTIEVVSSAPINIGGTRL